MNSLGGIFLTSFLIGLSGAITPGPVMTVAIVESMRRGFWAGPLIVLGHGILELLLFIALTLGLGRFLTQPAVKEAISVVGGVVLIWLGAKMAWGSYQAQISLSGGASKVIDDPCPINVPCSTNAPYPTGNPCPASGSTVTADPYPTEAFPPRSSSTSTTSSTVLAGFLVSISNPYWTIWWATIGLSYIALSLPFGIRGLTSFYGGHILSDLCWYTFISGLIALGKRPSRIYHPVILICGIFLIVFGIYFLYSGFHSFIT